VTNAPTLLFFTSIAASAGLMSCATTMAPTGTSSSWSTTSPNRLRTRRSATNSMSLLPLAKVLVVEVVELVPQPSAHPPHGPLGVDGVVA
jgi:hypothetical protein